MVDCDYDCQVPEERITAGHLDYRNIRCSTARKLHAAIVEEAAEQGEDIMLSQTDLRVLAPYFSEVVVETRNLLAMGKRLLRRRFEKPWARALVRTLERMDGALLTLAPPLQNW